jgi:hypothetical protein
MITPLDVATPSVRGRLEVSTVNGASSGERSVAEEQCGIEPADDDQHPRGLLDGRYPGQNEGEVGAGADPGDEQHMVTTQTLARDGRVLGADGHDVYAHHAARRGDRVAQA